MMEKSLFNTFFDAKTTAANRILLWILVFFPILFFASSTNPVNCSKPISSGSPDSSAVIYMASGSVMVGIEHIYHAEVVHLPEAAQKTKPELPSGKAIATKIPKKQIAKIETPVSTDIPVTTGEFIFSSLPISGCAFSADAKIHAIGLIPTTNSQKFSSIAAKDFEDYIVEFKQLKENSYTFHLFSAFQHCRISSLRAPPIV